MEVSSPSSATTAPAGFSGSGAPSGSSQQLRISFRGGNSVAVSKAVIARHPETMLGALVANEGGKLAIKDEMVFEDREAAVFEALILPFYTKGVFPFDVPASLRGSLSIAEYLEELDFYGLTPPMPSSDPEMARLFNADVDFICGRLTADARMFERLKAGYIPAIRCVTPYQSNVLELAEALAAFLAKVAEELPSESIETAFEAAKSDLSWCAAASSDSSYAKSLVKACERLVSGARREIMRETGLQSPPGVLVAARAAKTSSQIYSSSLLLANSAVAQHLVRRRLAAEGLDIAFSYTCWPELSAISSASSHTHENPYHEGSDLPAGSVLVSIWKEQLVGSTHVEPFVWDSALPAILKQKVAAAGISCCKKGVLYLLADVKALD